MSDVLSFPFLDASSLCVVLIKPSTHGDAAQHHGALRPLRNVISFVVIQTGRPRRTKIVSEQGENLGLILFIAAVALSAAGGRHQHGTFQDSPKSQSLFVLKRSRESGRVILSDQRDSSASLIVTLSSQENVLPWYR